MKRIPLLPLTLVGLAACQPDDPVAPSNGGGPGGGAATYDWSACPVEERPIWLAYQDGDGDWTPVVGTNGQYTISISSEKGGVAYVIRDSEGHETTHIRYLTGSELNAGLQMCASTGSIKTVLGTANGLSSDIDAEWFDQGRVHLGPAAVGQAFADVPSFAITGTWNGPEDLLAYRSRFSFGGTPPLHTTDRCIIRRNQNPANGSTIPTFDLNGAESFSAATSTLSIIGGTPDQIDMSYIASGDCLLKDGASVLYSDIDVSGTNAIAGIPVGRQVAGELHCLRIIADQWIALRVFATMEPQTVQVPSMATPTITTLTSSYARLEAGYTVPPGIFTALHGHSLFSYGPTNGNTASVFTSFGWVDMATATIAPPEFEGLVGWDAAWWPQAGQPGTWTLSVQSIDFDCHQEGDSYTLMKNGTY